MIYKLHNNTITYHVKIDLTRVRGITRYVSARRWEGDDWSDARPKPPHS